MKRDVVLLIIAVFYWHSTYGQEMLGSAGQFNIPTADMQQSGTFRGGINYIPEEVAPVKYNTGIYYIDFTFFSFFEVTFRETLLKSRNAEGKMRYKEQDRSMSFRARLLKESKYIPAFVIGTTDPYSDQGNNYYASVYGVVTKGFELGNCGTLKASAGYVRKLNKAKQYNGGFGGIRFVPQAIKNMYVACEYDTKRFNAGIGGTLFRHLGFNVWTCKFKNVSGGINYIYTIKM